MKGGIMPNYELHNQLKQLSGYVYKNSEFKKPNNWMVVDSTESRKSGFYSETFMNGNNIVIAFRGTDIKRGKKELTKDMYSNACMGLSLPPSQIINAQSYYEKIKRKYPNSNIILTGHSLGGSLAQILGSEYGNQTVTFNAYGTANLLKTQIKYSDNIINYGNEDDIVFSSNVKNQI